MRLRLDTIALSGLDSLDTGLRALALVPSSAGGSAMVYAVTGPGGGISAYRIGADGLPVLSGSLLFDPAFSTLPANRIAVTEDGTALILGATTGGVLQSALHANGGIGPVTVLPTSAGMATTLAADGAGGLALSGLQTAYLSWPDGALLATMEGADALAFTADGAVVLATRDGALLQHGADGGTDSIGAAQGLAARGATALATVAAHGTEFVLLAGAGSGSLSVAEIAGSGDMVLRDHILDTRTTRFGAVQDVAAAEVNGQVFVVAGGGDDGLSLLTLLPDGRLVHLHALENGAGGGLGGVTRLAMGQTGAGLQVFALTDSGAGITTLSLHNAGSGSVLRGSGHLAGGAGQDLLVAESGSAILSGGAGDDILVAGSGPATMTGGAGADSFVMTAGGGPVTITDFSAGEDRLDLSDYMMLRAPSQLTVTPTGDGATIRYRTEEVRLHSADGAPLEAEDLFGAAFDWPDRMPILTPEPDTGEGADQTDAGPGSGTPPPDDPPADPPDDPPDTPPAPHGGWAVATTPDAGHARLADATLSFAPAAGAPLTIGADGVGRFDLSAAAGQNGLLTLSRAYDPGTDPRIGVMDALEVLRMAVGLEPTYGAATPADLIAADIGGNGRVDVFDALTVLNVALGFEVATPPRWRFLDAQADLSEVRAQNTAAADGVMLDIPENGLPDLDLTALLTGHIAGW